MTQFRFFRIIILGVFSSLAFFLNHAEAGETSPATDETSIRVEASKIQELTLLSAQGVFEALKGPAFLANRRLTVIAIHTAFGHRRIEAIKIAENIIKEPLIEIIDGQSINRARDFNLSKMVFEAFPDEATQRLLKLYQRSDGITRGNIIRASGGIDGGSPIDSLLIKALEDTSAAEEETPEQLGEPLRVCDLAYNQVVFRQHIRNGLRTISSSHRIEVRDYYLDILRSHLFSGHS